MHGKCLGVGKDVVGCIGWGKLKRSGKIDLAVMQSLSRCPAVPLGSVNALVETYGQVIVVECHAVGAVSFDAMFKQTKAKYALGLTATPLRRDGQQPIIFMQCGSIRHTVARSEGAPIDLAVSPLSGWARSSIPAARHAGAGDAGVLEGHVAAVRRPAASQPYR